MFLQKLPPVARAGLTSAVVMSCGDAVCQKIQQRTRTGGSYDWRRTQRFGLVGLTLHGPYFFYGFRAIDHVFGPARTFTTVIAKITAGQLTIFPVYVAAFFTYMGLLEGGTWQSSVQKTRATFAQTYKTGSIFWPIANAVNLRYIPPAQRVTYVNAMGLVWNAFLSWVNAGAMASEEGRSNAK